MTKYTITQFHKDYPTNDACLETIFRGQYPGLKGYYRIRGRKCWANAQGQQIHPLRGTIFEKSSTPLTVWFEAMYLFSISKNGVSAKEMQRHFGVTYKCAWRMASQIRNLMQQGSGQLRGTVEADETYLQGRKIPVAGAVRRGGAIRVKALPNLKEENIEPFLKGAVSKKARLITDDARVYQTIDHLYKREKINKSKEGYARGKFHVNTVEAFWSQVNRSIAGTYHFISEKHAQKYLDEFAFRYSYRDSSMPLFSLLVARAAGR